MYIYMYIYSIYNFYIILFGYKFSSSFYIILQKIFIFYNINIKYIRC